MKHRKYQQSTLGSFSCSPTKVCLWILLCIGVLWDAHIFRYLSSWVALSQDDHPMDSDPSLSLYTRGLTSSLLQDLLDDFDSVIGCGYVKCFFPSRSDPTTGWLVMREARFSQTLKRSMPMYPVASQTWEFLGQQQLELNHLYLQAPFVTGPLSATHMATLQSKFPSHHNTATSTTSTQQLIKLCPPSTCRLWEGSPGGYVIQRMRRAPTSALLYKFVVDDDDPQQYSGRITPSWEDFITSEKHTSIFIATALHHLDQMIRLVQDEPAWAVDLQFLITTNGTLYHLDLDRLWEPAELNPPGWREKYQPQNAMAALNALRNQVASLQPP